MFNLTVRNLFKVIIVSGLAIAFLTSCKRTDALVMDEKEDPFFSTSVVIQGNPAPLKEVNEAWVNNAIFELKKLNVKDKFTTRVKIAGQPYWKRSLTFTGGDGAQTIITPMYTADKVSGAVFSTFDKKGKFHTQVLSSTVARKYLQKNNTSIHSIGIATYEYLIKFLETGNAEPVIQANTNTTANMEFFYTVCNWVPVLVYAPSTVVFQKQCHTEAYYGDYQAWDYYYSNNYNWIEEEEGYYESYDQEAIDKAVENGWEREKIDTIDISNNPCLTNVVRRLMANPTTDWGKIVSNLFSSSFGYNAFDAYPNFKVKFNVVASLPNNKAAHTRTLATGLSIIDVSADVFDHCTDLFAASVLIHEFSHAYMSSMLMAHFYADSTTVSDFNGCFSSYGNWMYDETWMLKFDDNATQHEYMAGFMVNGMAAALKEFDNSAQSDEFYWKMAWGSLRDTPTWQYYSTHPMTSESQKNNIWFTWPYALTQARIDDINDVIYAEQESTGNKKGVVHNFNNCY